MQLECLNNGDNLEYRYYFQPHRMQKIPEMRTLYDLQSHKVCRTIGIETGCQNTAVAISIIVLSFEDPSVSYGNEEITFIGVH